MPTVSCPIAPPPRLFKYIFFQISWIGQEMLAASFFLMRAPIFGRAPWVFFGPLIKSFLSQRL